jgi:MOSC domain-containing protein YiiM
MQAKADVSIVAGRGIEGDRYFDGKGTFSDKPGPDRHVMLISLEAIEAFEAETSGKLAPGDARRNVVTRGVPLNDLVGREFTIGGLRFRGVRLCEPCKHLQAMTGVAVLPGLVKRGGLRAEALVAGTLRVGDRIVPVDR